MRGDCLGRPRPCPWAACRYHLGFDLNSAGSIRLNRAGGGHRPVFATASAQKHFDKWVEVALAEVQSMQHTCALDVVDQEGPQGLSDIARLTGVTREMVRQIEIAGFETFRESGIELDVLGKLREGVLGEESWANWQWRK